MQFNVVPSTFPRFQRRSETLNRLLCRGSMMCDAHDCFIRNDTNISDALIMFYGCVEKVKALCDFKSELGLITGGLVV